MSTFVTAVSRLPLLWVALYTLGLPAALRTSRRREIRSDTYEHLTDQSFADSPAMLAWDVVQSLVGGVPDDLRWRATYISVWGTFGQSLVISSPLAALSGFIAYHTSQQLAIAVVVAIIVEVAATCALAGLSLLEVSVNSHAGSFDRERPTLEHILAAAALVAFPILLLVAQLIIPFAEGADPVGDKDDLVRRADDTTRWVTGYATLALAVLTAMYAMLHLGVVLRMQGSIALGTLGPIVFCLGGLGVIIGGPGVVGIGLAQAVDAGLDGTAYLEASGEVGLVFWWFGSLVLAVGLILIGYAVWSTHLLSGITRHAVAFGFALEAIAIGLLPGLGGSGAATLPAAFVGILVFSTLALGLVRLRDGAVAGQPLGATMANG